MIPILRTVRGSVTYGMDLSSEEAASLGVAASDRDRLSVVAEDLLGIFSLRRPFEATCRKREDGDEEIHELRHFMRLCTKANPNILECLAVDERFVEHLSPAGKVLRESIGLFMNTKPLAKSYCGYIEAQLHRYVFHAPGEGSTREPLVRKLGYDSKAAAHVIRLLNTGIDALRTGRLVVYRPEAKLLRAIRLGKVSKEEYLAMVEERKAAFREAEAHSVLAPEPDLKAIDRLYRRLAGMIYGRYVDHALRRLEEGD